MKLLLKCLLSHPYSKEEPNSLNFSTFRALFPKFITKELDLRSNPLAEIARDAAGNFTSASEEIRGTATEVGSDDEEEIIDLDYVDPQWEYYGEDPTPKFRGQVSCLAEAEETGQGFHKWVRALHLARELVEDGIDLYVLAEIADSQRMMGNKEAYADMHSTAANKLGVDGKRRRSDSSEGPEPIRPQRIDIESILYLPPEPRFPASPYIHQRIFSEGPSAWLQNDDTGTVHLPDGERLWPGKPFYGDFHIPKIPWTEDDVNGWLEVRDDVSMDEPIVETTVTNGADYMQGSTTHKARFPFTNGPEYCIEASNDFPSHAYIDEEEANVDPTDGEYVPREWKPE
ncbi:hypothetical protein EPUS_03040 [Endocarpon pusillum Z07020]|uniref:Uncharacterized protein n=1 Tax=Endocarpon pusillum (strain Z07020 / HMAS-L-300199) TaxID=1263415 RepID=U1HV43_ENDPU|nr:uncharacterized protein EPUS_03040 [Endocarpon pusillum Z07020]ERF73199.1 hypothetical protein EPUS_03040 [Endocarpon pusillum Z07020]